LWVFVTGKIGSFVCKVAGGERRGVYVGRGTYEEGGEKREGEGDAVGGQEVERNLEEGQGGLLRGEVRGSFQKVG